MPSTHKVEYGDFQTPAPLAKQVCDVLRKTGVSASSILEPTCGRGALLLAAAAAFPRATRALGVDINGEYLAQLETDLLRSRHGDRIELCQADFYTCDWKTLLVELPDPLLIIGNPPWVTNSVLGGMSGRNLPRKSNFQGHVGLDAVTGKSNFDISESMLITAAQWLDGRQGTLAVLCKTSVARKVLSHIWKHSLQVIETLVFSIDAKKSFGAAVDACLLVCQFSPCGKARHAKTYESLSSRSASGSIGFIDGQLIADVAAYESARMLIVRPGSKTAFPWRSGVKHDCQKVMEFDERDGKLINGFGESVAIEDSFLFPMLKGSQVARTDVDRPSRWMLIPQSTVGEDTSAISQIAPNTWDYLQSHAALLEARKSSIYRKRPRFSVFGVGPYTFEPWKVAIASMYKTPTFCACGPHRSKGVVFDDTVNFLACQDEGQSRRVARLLDSDLVQNALNALVFWDSKRPVTIDILRRIDLNQVAILSGEPPLRDHCSPSDANGPYTSLLF